MNSKVLRGRGQGFCDDSATDLVIKRVTMGGEGQTVSKIALRHLWFCLIK